MFRKKKFLIGGLIFAVAVAVLLFVSFQAFFVPQYLVSEAKAKADTIYGKQIKLEGKVVENPDQLKANWDSKNMFLQFTLSDLNNPADRIPVTYRGTDIPDPFWTNPGAVVQGTYRPDGIFEATTIFTKCPSRYYEAPQETK